MKLSDLVAPELVLPAFEIEDKWQAIRRMAQAAAEAGALPRRLLKSAEDALLVRERSMTTGMENGVAIPHAAIDGIEEVIAVLALSRTGIPFEALDGQPARILVCLIIPRPKKLLHIKTLASTAKLLSRPDVRERLLACETPDEVVTLLRAEDR